jgi:hypothetical protein
VTKRKERRRPWFRYKASWTLEEEGQNVISLAWQQHVPTRDSWAALGTKLQQCKIGLNAWQKATNGHLRGLVVGFQKRIEVIQDSEGLWNIAEIKQLQQEVNLLLEKEDLRWKQREKEDWLKNGDRSTRYYHACANSRRQKNKIWSIRDEAGQI